MLPERLALVPLWLQKPQEEASHFASGPAISSQLSRKPELASCILTMLEGKQRAGCSRGLGWYPRGITACRLGLKEREGLKGRSACKALEMQRKAPWQ